MPPALNHVVTLGVVLWASSALAFSGGIFGRSISGCSGPSFGCHSQVAVPTTRVCVAGLPTDGTFAPGASYELAVFVDGLGLPPAGALQGGSVAGFNLEVSAGSLASLDESTQIETVSNRQATHTASGNHQNHWSLVWSAPTTGTVTMTLAGNAVNGSGSNDQGDLWNTMRKSLAAGSGGGKGEGLDCNPPLPLPQLLPLPPDPGVLSAH
jgi:hypothetical protein